LVYAIGFTKSRNKSITSGHVSLLNHNLILTDVNTPPGYSGGPLIRFNSQGKAEIIGINTAISAQFGLISSAIRTDIVFSAIPDLLRGGVVTHVDIQMRVDDNSIIHPDMFESLTGSNYPPKEDSLVVILVKPDSNVGKAGIKTGDIITRFNFDNNDFAVTTTYEFWETLFLNAKPGDIITFTITRANPDGKPTIHSLALELDRFRLNQ